MGVMAADALSHSRLSLGEKLSMHARPVLLELIDRQGRIASLHVLDVTVAAATRENDLLWRKLAPIASATTLREITVVLRRIPTMTSIASDSGMRMDIVLPWLGNPIFEG
jgi:hypothetical protein